MIFSSCSQHENLETHPVCCLLVFLHGRLQLVLNPPSRCSFSSLAHNNSQEAKLMVINPQKSCYLSRCINQNIIDCWSMFLKKKAHINYSNDIPTGSVTPSSGRLMLYQTHLNGMGGIRSGSSIFFVETLPEF